MTTKITAERIRFLFDYNPETGEFRRRKTFGLKAAIHSKTMLVDGEWHQTARFIWLHYHGVWPANTIDHINRQDHQNQISNLREATYSQNNKNIKRANPYGLKGIQWTGIGPRPWRAKITVDYTQIYLGSFATKEEAAKAYEEACLKYHGEFAQLGVK